MKINAFERLFVNNPIRQSMIRKNLATMNGWFPQETFDQILEVGCGFGAGIMAIDDVMHPDKLCAFDLDENMVAKARQRTNGIKAELDLQTGDGENVHYPDNTFDAVCEFTIFHHIPNWQKAIEEVFRVLKPGGIFFFEELCREFHFDAPIISFFQQKFTVHPWETIPDVQTFHLGLQDAGLQLSQSEKFLVNGWIIGAARKDHG